MMARRRRVASEKASFGLAAFGSLVALAASWSDLTSGSVGLYLLVGIAGAALVGAYIFGRADRVDPKDVAVQLAHDQAPGESAGQQTPSAEATAPAEIGTMSEGLPLEARLIWEWSLLERQMRRAVSATGGAYREGQPIRRLLQEFAAIRNVPKSDLDGLLRSLHLRNYIVHGSDIRVSATELAELVGLMRRYRVPDGEV